MTLKLTNTDYITLYPYLSPNEIAAEFKGSSKPARTIQRLYKTWGYIPQRSALLSIVNKSYAIADMDVDEITWNKYVWQEIAKERVYRIGVVKSRLEELGKMYQ